MKICINEDCRAELADGAEFCPDCNTKQAVGSEGKNGEEQTITG